MQDTRWIAIRSTDGENNQKVGSKWSLALFTENNRNHSANFLWKSDGGSDTALPSIIDVVEAAPLCGSGSIAFQVSTESDQRLSILIFTRADGEVLYLVPYSARWALMYFVLSALSHREALGSTSKQHHGYCKCIWYPTHTQSRYTMSVYTNHDNLCRSEILDPVFI